MPRFFFRTTTNPKSMNPKQKPSPTGAAYTSSRHGPRPRLDRRNAVKHFDYEASTSSSSSAATQASSRVSALEDSNCSLHTRSLDIDLQTSFRVEGSEGEIEFIFKNLGLSGIEDFSIPVDAWESRKIRSVSDVFSRSPLTWEDSFREEKEEEEEEEEEEEKEGVRGEEVVGRDELVGARVLTELTGARCGRPMENSDRIDVVDLRSRERGELGSGINGIIGSRPPMLQPPPSMRLPMIDNTCSTWDLLRDFAPAENGDLDRCDKARFAPSSEEEKEEEEEEEEVVAVESKVKMIMAEWEQDSGIRVGETRVSSASCSSISSDDDFSCSPYNISPNTRDMRTITYWEKGQLLGRGSFGSVYEGIAE